MAKRNAAALRAAREERRASRTPQATSPQSQDQIKNKTASGSATPAVVTPESLTAAVYPPSSVERTAPVDLVLFGSESKDPHWTVFASGRPVAEIRLRDQEEPEKIATVFVTEQYADSVREAAKQINFAELLQGLRARPYVASVAGADAYKQIEAQVKTDSERQLRASRAELRDNALNMLNLVVMAQTKNFLGDTPLKAELYTRMVDSGIDQTRAVALIEASYQAKAPEHFDAMFKQAFKWMDLQPQALAELEEQIKGLNHRTPHVAAATEIPVASAQSPSFHNVNLQTRPQQHVAGYSDDTDDKADLKASLGLRQRHRP